jgi:murein DD-endopeptidase MepM/ murein hydrolase activator NlpD
LARVPVRPALAVLALALCGCPRRAPAPRPVPLRGVWHQVESGDTVSGLAERYRAPREDIVEINGIVDDRIAVGSELFIPGSRRPGTKRTAKAPPPAPAAARKEAPRAPMRWPVSGGRLTSRYGTRWGKLHEGIDIAAPEGTEIVAAADGKVIYSGAMRGYGNVVLIDHGGLVTVYAHNHRNLVREGEGVKAGERIARVGQTGRATGPHLHFEVRRGVIPQNPTRYLEEAR